MPTSSFEPMVKPWKGRFRFLMFLKSRRTGIVNHVQMLKLAQQIDAHRRDAAVVDLVRTHPETPESALSDGS